jgi:hypothetical protein
MLGKKLNYINTYRRQRGYPISASLIIAELVVSSKWGRNRLFNRSDYQFGVYLLRK